jgi:membrane protease subunit HflC
MKKLLIVLVLLLAFVALFFILGPFYILTEGEQAVIVRFGKIERIDTEAGFKWKAPFIDTVSIYSKKIQSWDGSAQRLPTSENQFIWVDTTARWRIADLKKFYESVGSITQAQSRLDDVVDSEVRKIIARNPLREAVRNSNTISEIKYSDDLTQSVYDRMMKERNQIAQAFRSDGEGEKSKWMGQMERELQQIQSTAVRKAKEVMAKADAEALEIRNSAYNRDPAFADYWMALEEYKALLPKFNKTLTTEADFFKFLYDKRGRR